MKRLTGVVIIAMAIAFIAIGCEDNEYDNNRIENEWRELGKDYSEQSIEGTWWLEDVIIVESGLGVGLLLQDCMCYFIKFDNDGTLTVSIYRSYLGSYKRVVEEDNVVYRVSISRFGGEIGDEWRMNDFWWEVFTTIKNFEILGDELRLYYNDGKNYLLYTR